LVNKLKNYIMKHKVTIEEAQDLRKQGYTIVVNNTYKKVLLVTKNEKDAFNLKKQFLLKNKVVKVFSPLVRMKITKAEVDKALRDLELGLNCNI